MCTRARANRLEVPGQLRPRIATTDSACPDSTAHEKAGYALLGCGGGSILVRVLIMQALMSSRSPFRATKAVRRYTSTTRPVSPVSVRTQSPTWSDIVRGPSFGVGEIHG